MKSLKHAVWRTKKIVLSIILGSSMLFGNSSAAFAWKPTTHVYLVKRALEDALDDGMVTIERLDPATGKIVGVIGEYAVDAAVLDALKKFPDQFRSGILGPNWSSQYENSNKTCITLLSNVRQA